MAVAGCASNYENMTADEKLLHEQSDSFVEENVIGGAATGAIIGAIAGALLGAAIGGDAESAGYGAAAGLGAGAIVGGVDGYLQAKQAQEGANEVLMARSVAEDVRKDNQKLAAVLQTTTRVVEAEKQKLARLQEQVASNQITLDEARDKAASVRENSEVIEDVLSDAREQRDKYIDARNQLVYSAELDGEINRLNSEIAELERQLASLNTSLELTDLAS
jgi:uncharacterized protein YcfJ